MSNSIHPLLAGSYFKGITFYYFCPLTNFERKKKLGIKIEKFSGVKIFI